MDRYSIIRSVTYPARCSVSQYIGGTRGCRVPVSVSFTLLIVCEGIFFKIKISALWSVKPCKAKSHMLLKLNLSKPCVVSQLSFVCRISESYGNRQPTNHSRINTTVNITA
jgi:hypothetical protein